MKKISIITPCFNAEKFIEETVRSVIGQTAILSKKAALEYIICDGKSTDKTVSIVESIIQELSSNLIAMEIISEPDLGMYDALSKGLKKTSGDIVAYINAGDFYNKCAFDVVLDIFENDEVNWLTGYQVAYNEKSQLVYAGLPYKYRKEFLSCGFYGTKLPSVQQESTFWSSQVNQLIDYEKLSKFKYAGDLYLWVEFSKKYQLKIVESHLGGFKVHRGQLSSNKKAYYSELESITVKPSLGNHILATFDKILWESPNKFKKLLNKKGIYSFDHGKQIWR